MLRRIGLTNFKCFEKLELSCAPLNLLCGLNGMGKSSVIQALLVLRQSFETGTWMKAGSCWVAPWRTWEPVRTCYSRTPVTRSSGSPSTATRRIRCGPGTSATRAAAISS